MVVISVTLNLITDRESDNYRLLKMAPGDWAASWGQIGDICSRMQKDTRNHKQYLSHMITDVSTLVASLHCMSTDVSYRRRSHQDTTRMGLLQGTDDCRQQRINSSPALAVSRGYMSVNPREQACDVVIFVLFSFCKISRKKRKQFW